MFRENLGRCADADDFTFLFYVRGHAGVGKTSLVRQWETLAREHGAATAYMDDAVHSALEAMEAVSGQLSGQGIALRRFEKLLATFRQRSQEVRSALDVQAAAENGAREEPSLTGSVTAQIGLAGLGMVPVVGALAGALDPQQVAQGVDRVRGAVAARLRSLDDAQLVLDPVRTLTPVFLGDLADAARRLTWVVLFFDVHERTGPALDGWLRDIAFNDVLGALPANVQIVLSGQDRLDGGWGDYWDLITEVPVEVFTEEEARALLAQQGIGDAHVVEVILQLSGRLPVLVRTLAQSRPASAGDVGDPSETAVERFLRWEADPSRRAAAVACALPLQLDEDVYRVLAPAEARDQYPWLRRLAFVLGNAGTCRYHEVVRGPMLRLQRTRSPARWQAAHAVLADLFRARREQVEEHLSDGEWWTDPLWREHRANETYHRLCGEPHQCLPDALAEMVPTAVQGSGTVRRWAQLVAQAGRDTADERLARWGEMLVEAAQDDTSAALNVLNVLLNHSGLTPAGQTQAHMARGRLHRTAERYEQALADYAAALALDPEHAGALRGYALTQEQLGHIDEAMSVWDDLVRLQPDDPWHRAGRGYVRLAVGRVEDAIEDFSTSVELASDQKGFAYFSRSKAYTAAGRHQEALDDLDRALQLDPDNAYIRAQRSVCRQSLQMWDEALNDLSRATELEPDPWLRARLAELLLELGRPAESLEQVETILATPDGTDLDGRAWPYTIRAWALHAMGRETDALGDLERAVAVADPPSAMALAMRGWLRWEAGRLSEAHEDFTSALAAEEQWSWCLVGRGVVRAYQHDHLNAVDDFAQAFSAQFGIADAREDIAVPLVDLLREHLPRNQASVTAAIRLAALASYQVQWPGLRSQVRSVLALRPSPRLVIAGVSLLRRTAAAVNHTTSPGAEASRRHAWSRRLLSALLHAQEESPG
ncbi:tetratricopeptide repeat protein [Streptomyces sp. NPDC059680]|uniref:tetratricopeptide repeat protein n=1 Tax=Streptomyces sp. NPDC059680 TaxID=3346904 RepID=UPI0036AFB37B